MSGMTIWYVEVIYIDGSFKEEGLSDYGYSKQFAEREAKRYNKQHDVALARVKSTYIMG